MPRSSRKVEKLYVENGCLTNIRPGESSPPKGERWIYYLFVHKGSPKAPSDVEEIAGDTKRQRDLALRRFMRQRGVVLIEEEAGAA